jgi:hypothetical protein
VTQRAFFFDDAMGGLEVAPLHALPSLLPVCGCSWASIVVEHKAIIIAAPVNLFIMIKSSLKIKSLSAL